MFNSNAMNIMRMAINHFGPNLQKIVAIEELSELQKELTKDLRGKRNSAAIAEEIADVEIMLEQLKIMFGNRGEVEDWKQAKLLRLERGLNGE